MPNLRYLINDLTDCVEMLLCSINEVERHGEDPVMMFRYLPVNYIEELTRHIQNLNRDKGTQTIDDN